MFCFLESTPRPTPTLTSLNQTLLILYLSISPIACSIFPASRVFLRSDFSSLKVCGEQLKTDSKSEIPVGLTPALYTRHSCLDLHRLDPDNLFGFMALLFSTQCSFTCLDHWPSKNPPFSSLQHAGRCTG